MKFSLGFSPCPNDTFIFDALVNKKIDTRGFEFEVVLADVQQLNSWAQEEKLDITKISYGALPLFIDKYIVLNAGGALGKGVGPLFVAKEEVKDWAKIQHQPVGIPGENTTANALFSLAYPWMKNKKFMLFSEIENAILNDEIRCGVIIHENRFTYQQKGLIKLADLGEYWETHVKKPIPLGGIVIKRKIDEGLSRQLDQLIKESIQYAFANYPRITDYVRRHSQEMNEKVMKQHIDLYVTTYSLDLGSDGKDAILEFLDRGLTYNYHDLKKGIFL
ncbi:MAG: 1,4-dihydroxy-6-naphthoate synthase [Chitinophagaceae bacterium]|nr:1,4-dihydroxy-6-naphthoate synthase [Chitinophagaceae bacterium]